jgi:hypothetical protein
MLLGVLVITGLLCSLFLLLAANVSSLGSDTIRVRLDTTETDEPDQAAGEPTGLEPGGKGSWQEMLDHEATHAPQLTPGTPEDLPYMPPPEPQDITGQPTRLGPKAPPLAPAAPVASSMQAGDTVAPDDNTKPTHWIGISIGLICLGVIVSTGIVVGIRRHNREPKH